jgi:ElaB/YqjD/DUF883 family membrane-anchored ribosome-binding protein
MSLDFEKYMKKIRKIEQGVEQVMKDTADKSKEALEMKKTVQILVEKSKKELEDYKSARKVNEDIIETKTKELIDVNAQISEMENKIITDTQQKLGELDSKIEEAKMETAAMIQMNEMVSKIREMLESQGAIKGQVF